MFYKANEVYNRMWAMNTYDTLTAPHFYLYGTDDVVCRQELRPTASAANPR